jgi:hypothetical protein
MKESGENEDQQATNEQVSFVPHAVCGCNDRVPEAPAPKL